MSTKPTQADGNAANKSVTSTDTVRQELERIVGPNIQGGQREQVLQKVAVYVQKREEQFSGPIAHPKHLEHYEQICPGAADRIITMAEREQAASITALENQQTTDAADQKRGMWFGFAAFLVLVGGALWVAHMGHPWLSGVFLATSALSAVAVFVKGRNGG